MSDKLNWAATQRQSYIAERLRNVGTLNRYDIEKEFTISAAQASLDIAYFLKNNPGIADYDKTLKSYVYKGETLNTPAKDFEGLLKLADDLVDALEQLAREPMEAHTGQLRQLQWWYATQARIEKYRLYVRLVKNGNCPE